MKLYDYRGFSMLELLVATMVAIVFALAGWSFQRTQAVELSDQAAALDATEKVRAAMGFMAREIRRAGHDPRMTALIVPGTKGISEARTDRILVQWDANGNGAIETNATDPQAESILYSYDSVNRRLQRTVNGVTETLVSDIPPGGFSLTYYDILDSVLPCIGLPAALSFLDRDLVTHVRIELAVDTIGSSKPQTLRLASRVTVRHRILDKL